MRSLTVGLAGMPILVAAACRLQVPAGPFRDVPVGHWAYQAVENLRQNGVLVGYPDQTKRKPRPGIEGVAEVGPIRPAQRLGEKNARPLGGAVITFQVEGTGKEVSRTKTDARGQFHVALAPGKYRVVPLPPNPRRRFPIGHPQSVTVKEGEVVHVTVEYDSGIR